MIEYYITIFADIIVRYKLKQLYSEVKEENIMSLEALNPKINSAHIYERVSRTDECRAYDSRLFYLISGELTVTISSQKPLRLAPGAVLFIPRGAIYKIKSKYMRAAVISFDTVFEASHSETPSACSPDMFDESIISSYEEIPPFTSPLYLSDMESERDNFISMCEMFILGEGEYLSSISARLKLVLIKLVEALDEKALPPFMVEGLGSYIRENCAQEISGTEIGAVFGYHPYYISSMLKERRGLTVKQYVTDYRLKMAKELLAYTSLPIADIAEKCGFTDASYFAKVFKSTQEISPKDYRNKFKGNFI